MSTILDPVAAALKTKVAAISGVTGYQWSQVDISPPCGVVELPTFRRTDVDAAEDHISQNDWRIDYPVAFYVEQAEPVASQQKLIDIVEAFAVAIDADQDLTNGGAPVVQEAKAVEATPFVELGQEPRVLIGYEVLVAVLKFV